MSVSVAVAFSGRLGSGKSTLANEVAAHLGCPVASFGGYLRRVAAERGLPDTRESLQTLGADILEREGPRPFAEAVLRSVGWSPPQVVVVEGVRHAAMVPVLRELVMPLPLLLVYLQTPEEVRLHRLKERGGEELAKLSITESHSTEADVRDKLRHMADLLLDSDIELAALVQSVTAAAHSFSQTRR